MKDSVIKYLQSALKVDSDGDIGPITREAYVNLLVTIASKEIGVSEIGQTNTGIAVQEYQRSTDLGGTGWPWCAAFICWVIKKARIFVEGNRPKTAAAYGFESWARSIGMSVISSPKSIKKGDIVIYNFSHIGIACSNSSKSGRFFCIEGNTNKAGSREGGSVLQKSRSISTVRSVIRL